MLSPQSLRLLLFGVFVFPCFSLFAQRKPLDYVLKDTTRLYGYVTRLPEGKISLQSQTNVPGIVYTAQEIKEYQYQKRIFISVPEGETSVFVERIVSGPVTLYQKDKSLSITADDKEAIDLDKNNFRSELKNRLKCSGTEKDFLKIRFSRGAIANVIKLSNQGKCDLDNIQYRKFGAYGGYGSLLSEMGLNNTEGSDIKMTSSVGSPVVGIFAEFPVYAASGFYFTMELSLTHSEPSFYAKVTDHLDNVFSYYVKVKTNSVTLPIGLKYTLPTKIVKPYARVSISGSYVSLDSPGFFVVVENTSTKNWTNSPIKSPTSFFYGAHVGVGAEIPFTGRKGIFIEGRYSLTAGGEFGTFTLDNSGFFIMAGFHI